MLSEARTIDGQAYTLSHQYDAASNLVRLTYPDGYQLNYNYDALNRITTVGNMATLAYRKDDQFQRLRTETASRQAIRTTSLIA